MKAVFVVSLLLIGLVSSSVVDRQLCRSDCEGLDCATYEICILDYDGCGVCVLPWIGLPGIVDSQAVVEKRQVCSDCESLDCQLQQLCLVDENQCAFCLTLYAAADALVLGTDGCGYDVLKHNL